MDGVLFRFNENRTTGFKWTPDLRAEGPCKNHIRLVSENYFVQQTDEMMMGVGGTAYMTYEISNETNKGECTILFILK